jgi:hypothetical protein
VNPLSGVMKNYLLLFLIFPILIFAQGNGVEENLVQGLVTTEYGDYLIVEDGFIALPDYDPYEEYYREIYGDSTIVNPNRVISGNYSITIIPYLIPEISHSTNIYFEEPLKLGMFIKLNNSSRIELTNFGYSFIDSLLTK